MGPPASVDPEEIRATRDRRRRRLPRTRPRAARLAPIQPTRRQATLPALGKKLVSKANRDGGGARCAAPAVPKRLAGDIALLGDDEPWRSDVAVPLGPTATPPDAHPLSRRQAVPGLGKMVRLGRRDAIPAMRRVPQVQDVVSACRLGTGAQASAGTRSGPAGATSGQADRTWAFSAAAGRWLRQNPVGQKDGTRLENHHGTGQAFTLFAPPWARAVYDSLWRDTVLAMDPCRQGSGRGAGEPAAARGHAGASLVTVLGNDASRRLRTPMRISALGPAPARVLGRLRSRL